MNHRGKVSLSTLALLCLSVVLPDVAFAQTAKDFVGTWTLVSESRAADAFGGDAKGMVIFDSNGRMMLQITGGARKKFASNNRLQGTPEENKAAVHGSIAYFGSYSFDEKEKTLTLMPERSSFSNWDGTSQKRTGVSITGDELKWHNPASSAGGSTELVWRRVK